MIECRVRTVRSLDPWVRPGPRLAGDAGEALAAGLLLDVKLKRGDGEEDRRGTDEGTQRGWGGETRK